MRTRSTNEGTGFLAVAAVLGAGLCGCGAAQEPPAATDEAGAPAELKEPVETLAYGGYEGEERDECVLVDSAEALLAQAGQSFDVDFDESLVLVIFKPFSSTEHRVAFEEITVEDETLVVRYLYEVTNKEVEGPPVRLVLAIPRLDMPMKVVEHKVVHTDEVTETFVTRGTVSAEE